MRIIGTQRRAQFGGENDPKSPQREMVRLLLYFSIAAVFTVSLLVILQGMAGGERGGSAIEAVVPENRTTPGVASIPNIGIDVGEWRPPVDELNALIDESTQTGRVKDDPRALNLLAEMALVRPHSSFRFDPRYKDVGGFERVDPAVLANPAKAPELRGHPVEVVGEIASVGLVSPAQTYGLDQGLFAHPRFHGVLDTGGVEVKFLLLDEIKIGEAGQSIDIRGRRFKAQGVFYRIIEEPRGPSGSWSRRSPTTRRTRPAGS